MNLQERVCSIVSSVMDVPVEEIHEDSSPDTIGNWDSVHHMNLILALEDEFGITFTDEQTVDLLNVRLIILTIEAILAEN